MKMACSRRGRIEATRHFDAALATRPDSLPSYDTRDFTPRWSPVEHQVGSFRLTDQSNHEVSDRDLDGRIHVASFFFASCSSLCPRLLDRLKPVQEAIRGASDVVMVSYSVTPALDTPAFPADFGRRCGVDPAVWQLLTGDVKEIQRLIRGSYFADDDREIDGRKESRILHSEKVLLVDGARRIRGAYNGTNPYEVQKLIEDIATLRGGVGRTVAAAGK